MPDKPRTPPGPDVPAGAPAGAKVPDEKRFPEDPPEDDLQRRHRDADLDISQTPPPAD